ncbi:sialidase-1-like [Ptychodera flava]|uniref:sialidase-1-like n=1 Tax=Ptychodera flava TaxID=63121 RepID=UPI00396A2448
MMWYFAEQQLRETPTLSYKFGSQTHIIQTIMFSATQSLLIFCLTSCACLCNAFRNVTPVVTETQLLWTAGQEEVSLYRIPAITTTPMGSVIAVSEARKSSGGDAGSKFLAIRRSLDGGYTWKPQQFLLDDGSINDGLNMGVILVDEETGAIFIVYVMCAHYDDCSVSTTHYIKSMDDGVSWGKSVNISQQIGTKMFAPGPGYGIQKKYAPHKGRLIVCGHGTIAGDGMFCLLSDDHGNTWRYGGMLKSIPYNQPKKAGDFEPDECQPIELPDGSIMVNARNQGHYHCACRVISRSYDGAETFPLENVYFDTALIEPVCAASTLYHNDVIFFSNPMSTSKRAGMTLQWSYNNGTTWTGKLAIDPGYSGYSCMTAFKNPLKFGNDVFIAYESGTADPSKMDSITLVRIQLY